MMLIFLDYTENLLVYFSPHILDMMNAFGNIGNDRQQLRFGFIDSEPLIE